MIVGEHEIGFRFVKENEGVGYRRVIISPVNLVKVTNNLIIVLMGK